MYKRERKLPDSTSFSITPDERKLLDLAVEKEQRRPAVIIRQALDEYFIKHNIAKVKRPK
jgi:hypothetical protein